MDVRTAPLMPLEALRLLAWLEVRDAEVAAHSLRVSRLAAALGRELGLREDRLAALELGARLHDIGKGLLPEGLIAMAGTPSPQEMGVVRTHPSLGANLLQAAGLPPELQLVAVAHHEWWDGHGYPLGLRKREIPFLARITAVADAFDAMTVRRCYRDAWSAETAAAEILAGSGTQFCPEVVAAFAGIFDTDLVVAG